MGRDLLQIIDANLNRLREGLRVCEDIARFSAGEKDIARSLKTLRHGATNAILLSKKIPLGKLVQTRDTKNDRLKFIDFEKGKDVSMTDIFMSNIERAKESLRVLEECCKLVDAETSRKYRRLRFNAYDIEKKSIKKIK